MVISKKTIIFEGFRGVPTFTRGSNFFRGIQMLISIETDITCDISGGSIPPVTSRFAPRPVRP